MTDGEIVRLDPGETVYRRLPPDYVHTEESGEVRMTTNAFVDNDDDGVSVYIKSRLQALGKTPDDIVASFGPGWAYAEVTVADLIAEKLYVVAAPDPDDEELGAAHGLIKTQAETPRKAPRRVAKERAQLHRPGLVPPLP